MNSSAKPFVPLAGPSNLFLPKSSAKTSDINSAPIEQPPPTVDTDSDSDPTGRGGFALWSDLRKKGRSVLDQLQQVGPPAPTAAPRPTDHSPHDYLQQVVGPAAPTAAPSLAPGIGVVGGPDSDPGGESTPSPAGGPAGGAAVLMAPAGALVAATQVPWRQQAPPGGWVTSGPGGGNGGYPSSNMHYMLLPLQQQHMGPCSTPYAPAPEVQHGSAGVHGDPWCSMAAQEFSTAIHGSAGVHGDPNLFVVPTPACLEPVPTPVCVDSGVWERLQQQAQWQLQLRLEHSQLQSQLGT